MWLFPKTGFPKITSYSVAVVYAVIISVCVATATYGQQAAAKYPSVVLVQLKAEKNRINALTKAKRDKDLEVLKRDVDSVMWSMINDFKDHFHYCPVYYYMDTNYEAIMAKKFEGVLLNADLLPATNIILNNTSTDYLIVYYGEPTWQTKKNRFRGNEKWHATNAEDMGGKPNGRGLIINDNNMQQIYYIYRLTGLPGSKEKQNRNPYIHESKKYDIEYYPCATELNRKLPYRNDD